MAALATETPTHQLGFRTEELFDTANYPIHQADSSAFRELVEDTTFRLGETNCAQLGSFIRPVIVEQMQEEAASLSGHAVFHSTSLNPYFTEPPEGLPREHPLMRFAPRRHGMVRADRFPREGVIWSIFQNADLCHFVARALGHEKLYTYRDPFGSVNINVQPEGCEFPWHFDNNEFTISLGLTQSPGGGAFEYVPNLRTSEDENYDAVQRVLDGDRSHLRSLVLKPGDLQLFKGGYTLHRVTAPSTGERQSLLLSYVTDPEDITTSDKAIRIWGEAAAEHYQKDKKIKETQ
ncbi:HalD/BesD family halogenase [Kiloniella sp. b19]|uniref:HalD/BesD family halogenase n=1 Tax=Kiloniella sp. GXU_MW_B19 TaxID=3141326 RepID=UPI0031DDF9A5